MFDPHVKIGNQMFQEIFDRHSHEVYLFDYYFEVLRYDDGCGNLLDQMAPHVYVEMKR